MEASEFNNEQMYEVDDSGLADAEVDGQVSGPRSSNGVRPHAQVHLLSPTDKCKVCMEPAAKHVHYGAMTCFSCRAFFRRSIQNKTAATYVCRRARNCEINLRTRRNCQFCRYNACIKAGMKPSWVLSEEERGRRFKKNRERSNGSDHMDQSLPGPSSQNKESLIFSDQPMETSPLNTPLTLVEQQQHLHPIVIKQENIKQSPETSPESNGALQTVQNCTKTVQNLTTVQQNPIASSSFQQVLLKTESGLGGESYILAPAVSTKPNQSAILVYTAIPQPQPQQQVQQQASTAVIVPTPSATSATAVKISSGQFLGTLPAGVAIASSSSATSQVSGSVSTIKIGQNGHHSVAAAPLNMTTKPQNPASTASSVIVQPQRQQNASNNLVVKQEAPSSSYTTRDNFKPAEIIVVPSRSAHASEPKPKNVSACVGAGAVTLNKIPSNIVSVTPLPSVTSLDDWDSNYEEDTFSSDEENERFNTLLRLNSEPEVKFCDDEWKMIDQMVKEHEDKYRSVNFGEELIKEMIMCSMFGLPLSTTAAINGYRLTVERITRIAHNLEVFTDLSKNDQSTLLMENADLLVSLRGAIFFDSRNKGVSQILISMGIEDMDTIKSIYTPLMKENSMKHIEYKTFNSIQTVANPSIESRYTSLQSRVANLLSNDAIITVLITYIILFNVDFCSLIDKRRVEQIQERFIRMLQRYIYSQVPRHSARVKLGNTIGMITNLREMADIKKQRKLNCSVKMP